MERGCRELISPCNRPILLLYSPARTGILFATRRIKGPAQRVASTRLCKRSDIFAKRTAACSITDEESLWRNSVYPTCSIFLSLLAGEFPPSFFSFSRKLLADTGPDIDRARDSDTKFCGRNRVARNCNKGRMLKFRSETDGFAFRTSPRLTMTMFLEIVECFDPDTKSIR